MVIGLNFLGAIFASYMKGQRAEPNVNFFYRQGRSHSHAAAINVTTIRSTEAENSGFAYRIVIALPTVGRLEYLEKTIQSYLHILSADDLIVVFVVKNQASVLDMLRAKFSTYLNNTIVVETGNPIRQYLLRNPCDLLAHHNDSLGRVMWRSSIVLEHAWLLYRVSFFQPQYLLVMEEDVIVREAVSFLDHVQNKLTGTPAQGSWNLLHLRDYRGVVVAPTHLGGAFGLLINASCPGGLLSLSSFLLRYFDDSPVDWLIGLYFSHLGSSFGVGASDLVVHIGKSSTKNFTDNVNDRGACPKVSKSSCATVMAQRRRRCNEPMVWEVSNATALAHWADKLHDAALSTA